MYRYTQNGRYLTPEQRRFYEENGYILLRNLVSHESLDEYEQRFRQICNREVDTSGMVIMKDFSLMKTEARGEFLISKVQDFLWDDVLSKYPHDEVVVNVVTNIIGEDVTAINSMVINKPPDAHQDTSRHPLHQDLHYFPYRPPDKLCASWTAMQRIDERNGCLFVVPGSHQGRLYPHHYPTGVKNKSYHAVEGLDDAPRVNLIMDKGDTVFFHPILLHGSGPNLTQGFRKAISVHYVNNNCEFFDTRGTIQENLADEIQDYLRKKGLSIKYEEFWKNKCRLIKGNPGHLHGSFSKL